MSRVVYDGHQHNHVGDPELELMRLADHCELTYRSINMETGEDICSYESKNMDPDCGFKAAYLADAEARLEKERQAFASAPTADESLIAYDRLLEARRDLEELTSKATCGDPHSFAAEFSTSSILNLLGPDGTSNGLNPFATEFKFSITSAEFVPDFKKTAALASSSPYQPLTTADSPYECPSSLSPPDRRKTYNCTQESSSLPESQKLSDVPTLQKMPLDLVLLIACGGPASSVVSSIKVRPTNPNSPCSACTRALHRKGPSRYSITTCATCASPSRSMVQMLSCCRQLWAIEIPVHVASPLYHARDYPPRRFRIVETDLCGDAIDRQQMSTLGAYAEGLVRVSLSQCRQLDDLSGLCACRFVSRLELRECYKLADLSGLADCECLEELALVQCFRTLMFSPLQHCRMLRSLDIHDNPYLSNLNGLYGCSKLSTLRISGCPGLTTIDSSIYSRFESLDKLVWNGMLVAK